MYPFKATDLALSAGDDVIFPQSVRTNT